MSTKPKPLLEGLTPQQIQEAAERWLALKHAGRVQSHSVGFELDERQAAGLADDVRMMDLKLWTHLPIHDTATGAHYQRVHSLTRLEQFADLLRTRFPDSPAPVDYKASFHAVLSEMSRRQLSCVDRKNEGDSAIYFLLQTLGVKFRSKEYGYEMGPLTRSISVEEIKRDFQDIAPKGSDQINGAQTTIINAASIRIKPQDAELGPL